MTCPSSSSPSIRSSDSSSASGESETSRVRGRGAAQDGRVSKRSGRARQRSRIGAPLEKPSDVLDQVEQRRLRPVDVVQRDDERPRHSERLEEPAERPGGLLGGARLVTRADGAEDQPLCDVPTVDVRQERTEGRSEIGYRDVAHDIREGEIRDAVAVRNAASDNDARVLLERPQRLPRETRLADARWPDDGGEAARRLAHRDVECIAQVREFAAATDEGRRDRAGEGRHVRTQAEQPPGNERPALALRLDLTRLLRRDGFADQVVGRLAEEHLAGLGSLLESRGHVHGVAGRQLLVGDRLTDDHLARVHAGSRRDAEPVLAPELLVETLERLAHLERRAHRAKRIVLVDGRHPEHGNDGIADELLDRAAVPLERRLHRIEVAPHHAPQRLGVEQLAERGRAGDVREDDGDHLARLGIARSRIERLAARAAEPCLAVVAAPAGATNHGVTLRRGGAGS